MNKNNPIRKLCDLDTNIYSKKLMATKKFNHGDQNGQEWITLNRMSGEVFL